MKKTKYKPRLGASKGLSGQYDSVAAIQRGLDQARAGLGRPADDVFDDLERGPHGRPPTREAGSSRHA